MRAEGLALPFLAGLKMGLAELLRLRQQQNASSPAEYKAVTHVKAPQCSQHFSLEQRSCGVTACNFRCQDLAVWHQGALPGL